MIVHLVRPRRRHQRHQPFHKLQPAQLQRRRRSSWVDFEDFKYRTGEAVAAFVGHLAGDADGLDAIQSEPEIVTWTVTNE